MLKFVRSKLKFTLLGMGSIEKADASKRYIL